MSNVLQQLWSPMQRALAAQDAIRAVELRDDQIEIGCESAYPFLQVDGWEPFDAPHGAAAARLPSSNS
jgi:hypothetical protein